MQAPFLSEHCTLREENCQYNGFASDGESEKGKNPIDIFLEIGIMNSVANIED